MSVGFSDWYIVDAPKTLEDVYGQDIIVNHIKSKRKTQKFDKSTFFLGQWGSGKTVLAKILAKSIACKNINKDGEPCETCPTCLAVNNETYDRDIAYLNGTMMSTDDVKKILDTFFLTPAIRDRAKVLICDETQGFHASAIDKFLIETQSPKSGFFFIFTAMSKLAGKNPGALQSRCKNWKMKVPTNDEIYMYLGGICQKKKLVDCPKEFLTEGLKFIAENSKSSFREAIQMLEQCYESKIFDINMIKETFDIVSYDDAAAVLADLSHGNKTENVFKTIMGTDYQDKFGLLLKVIGDASTYRTFGLQFIEDSEKWKWKYPAQIADGKYFSELETVFIELSKNAYLKRGEYQIALTRFFRYVLGDNYAGVTVNDKVWVPAGVMKDDTFVVKGDEQPKVKRRKI